MFCGDVIVADDYVLCFLENHDLRDAKSLSVVRKLVRSLFPSVHRLCFWRPPSTDYAWTNVHNIYTISEVAKLVQ